MSLLSFAKNFGLAGGNQAATALTSAMVRLAPETATAAELATMEEDLDGAGSLITKLQRELGDERKAYEAINARYTTMIGAAEHLQAEIDDPNIDPTVKASKEASLVKLLDQIEPVKHELDQDQSDIDATQSLLNEAESAYQQKARDLAAAKGNLVRAKQDMERAGIEEKRASQRAETARQVAGLATGSGQGINIALNAMKQTAQDTRDRAAAQDLKAKALTGAKTAEEDPNIAAAMAAVAGQTSTASAKDRLAALKR